MPPAQRTGDRTAQRHPGGRGAEVLTPPGVVVVVVGTVVVVVVVPPPAVVPMNRLPSRRA